MKSNHDAIVIGGGPGGSTVGYILAKAGLNVLLLEKDKFPRFHIGESLLPATNLVWERLGIRKQMDETFLHKGGGRWYTHEIQRLESDFSQAEKEACFQPNYPYAYMVERATWDLMLLENAARAGVDVRENTRVNDLIFDGPRLVGLKVSTGTNEGYEVRGNMIFDCSGNSAIIANKLGLRRPNHQKRMSVFAHYEAQALEDKLREGWFVGAMIDDGWVWTIPLSDNNISIGVVTSLKNYKVAKNQPEQFLTRLINELDFFKLAIRPNPKRVGDIHIHGNLGYTSDKFAGDGWVLVGDAAFFIDPCYSTGVYLAMTSAEQAADYYLKHYDGSALVSPAHFAEYEKHFRRHEKIAHTLVDTFYLATNNKNVRRIMPKMVNKQPFLRKFATATGGDLLKNRFTINAAYQTTALLSALLPDSAAKANAYNEQIFAKEGLPDFFCEEF